MKLISWNVNGIRAAIKKGFLSFLEQETPDVLCLQEVKAHKDQVSLDLPDYHIYWNAAEKKGYSSTAILTKEMPKTVFTDMVIEGTSRREADTEGRVITAEFTDFFLVTVYTPNSKRDLKRLPYRIRWDIDFFAFLKVLEKKKPVIFCGDLNVAHKEIDLTNPRSNTRSAGFTLQERNGFDRYVENGFVDTFRHFNKRPHHYTWWSYMHGARKRNIGWRLDYFCVSSSLLSRLENAFILSNIYGSDHCPVGINI
jgi:exodeoxyribonuclease-3